MIGTYVPWVPSIPHSTALHRYNSPEIIIVVIEVIKIVMAVVVMMMVMMIILISNSIQFNTIQYNTTQHNTTQHNTTQHNTTQRRMFFTCKEGSPLAVLRISSHCDALLASHQRRQFLIGLFSLSSMTTLHAVVSMHIPSIDDCGMFFSLQAADVTFRQASPRHLHQSSGFCSAHPMLGYVVGYDTAAVSIRTPDPAKRPTRALSVPRSTPITYLSSKSRPLIVYVGNWTAMIRKQEREMKFPMLYLIYGVMQINFDCE